MSKVGQLLAGLFFLGWGVALWFGFVLLNVGPCNTPEIPVTRSAPVVGCMLAYWSLGAGRFAQKNSIWPHYAIWGCAAFLAILDLPFLAHDNRGWYSYSLVLALLLTACAPSMVQRVNSQPFFRDSLPRRRTAMGIASAACLMLLAWIIWPYRGIFG